MRRLVFVLPGIVLIVALTACGGNVVGPYFTPRTGPPDAYVMGGAHHSYRLVVGQRLAIWEPGQQHPALIRIDARYFRLDRKETIGPCPPNASCVAPPGVIWHYVAIRPGTTSISLVPSCRAASPPCSRPVRVLRIEIHRAAQKGTCPRINPYHMDDAELRACRLRKIPLMRVRRLPDGGKEYDYGRRQVEERFRIPPPGFHILTASNARLRFYWLPERPGSEPYLAQWKRTMRGPRLVRPGKYLLQDTGGPVDHSEGARPREAGEAPPGYTVTRTANGIQLSIHFERRSYPAHALIPVTATLRNLSHKHLAIGSERLPYGMCSAPAISLVSVNSAGVPAEPVPPIPAPGGKCAAPQPKPLPIGGSITEHPLIVLWTPRLSVTVPLFNMEGDSYWGFDFRGPSARFSLYQSAGPTITVGNRGANTLASLTPPPGAGGPFYYRSWGRCRQSYGDISAMYWTARQDTVVPAICAHPIQWHFDVAWLNWQVASINLGAGKR